MSNEPEDGGHAWASETLRDLLTADRLRSYLAASNDDLDQALQLYDWNLAASAAVIQTSAMVEVVVRNALDAQLVAWATKRRTPPWTVSVPLDARGLADIKKARDRATSHGRMPLTHGKIVAELSFGFWRYLTAQRYHASLWVPALHAAFPGGNPDLRKRRREVERHLADLMLVRNRAAHHEPIHRRHLIGDFDAAVELAAWVHPDAGAWIAERSDIPTAMSSRPNNR